MQFVVIPHADRRYAGLCRRSVFRHVQADVRNILYVANDHSGGAAGEAGQAGGASVLVLRNDRGLSTPFETAPASVAASEHSYEWVRKELREAFPTAEHLVVMPRTGGGCADGCADVCRFIMNTVLTDPGAWVVMLSADLSHYGAQYGSRRRPAPRVRKGADEAPLIASVLSGDTAECDRILRSHPELTCSPRVLRLACALAAASGHRGVVVDYYDSWGIRQREMSGDDIDLYSVLDADADVAFVSYAGIVFSADARPSLGVDLAAWLAVSAVKTTVSLYPSTGPVSRLSAGIMPSWCLLQQMRNGVFVGTSERSAPSGDERTNCSYGSYESERERERERKSEREREAGGGGVSGHRTTADNIVSAASMCPRDARVRWRRAYALRSKKYTYKVEVLQRAREWTTVPIRELAGAYRREDGTGVRIRFSGGSSTFLPVVWRENPQWVLRDLLSHLADKASGTPGSYAALMRDPSAVADIYHTVEIYDSGLAL